MGGKPNFLVIFPVHSGCFAGLGLKVAVEIGEIIEPAFITDLSHAFMGFSQKLTGMPDPDLQQKSREGLFNP